MPLSNPPLDNPSPGNHLASHFGAYSCWSTLFYGHGFAYRNVHYGVAQKGGTCAASGLSPGWRRLHSSVTGKCSMALNNHVCLRVATLKWTLSPTADLLIRHRVVCSVEQSNKGKIASRQKYLNLFNVLQHCGNCSRIVCVSVERRCLQQANDLLCWCIVQKPNKENHLSFRADVRLHTSW